MLKRFLLKTAIAWAAIVTCAGYAVSKDVTLTLETPEDGIYSLEGRFSVRAPRQVVWNTLTDYDGVDDFVSSIVSSRFIDKAGDHVLVEQYAKARILFFSREIHVLLRIHEQPFRAIRFQDISGKDFKFYSGSWELEESRGVVSVAYKLKAKRRFHAPDFLAQSAFKKNARAMLEEVCDEILRRTETSP